MSETPAVYERNCSRGGVSRRAIERAVASNSPRARAEHKKPGRSGGGIRIALWAAGKSL